MSLVHFHFKSTGIYIENSMKNIYTFCFSVLCLKALKKMDEATALITQMIEDYPENPDLLIIRARLNYKDKNKVFIKIFFFHF